MLKRQIIYLESAQADLDGISDWLVDEASEDVALRYVQRIKTKIGGLSQGAERGSIRPGFPGIRVVGLLKSVNVAFVVTKDTVAIHRILYGGQDWQRTLTSGRDT